MIRIQWVFYLNVGIRLEGEQWDKTYLDLDSASGSASGSALDLALDLATVLVLPADPWGRVWGHPFRVHQGPPQEEEY